MTKAIEIEKCRHKSSAPQQMLTDLPYSQGGLGRHKCPICAYQLATNELDKKIVHHNKIIKCSHGNFAPEKILNSLSESQAGSGRHKCVVCAYQAGRADSRGVAHNDAWIPKISEQNGSITIVDRQKITLQKKPAIDWWKKDNERLREIGSLGEELVLEYEKSLLISEGKNNLANKVTHVSKVEGDHIGYDIRSFSKNGDAKYIEVKTTLNTILTPFFMSENERSFAINNKKFYYIYRLFELDEANEKAFFYIVNGDIHEYFNFLPTNYKVELKNSIFK